MIFGLALAALAASPAMAGKKRDAERQFYAPSVVAAPAAPAADGSIFQASMGYTPLTSGARATSVGDIITIVLVERTQARSEEHTSELQSLMRISYAVFCLKKKQQNYKQHDNRH